MNAQTVVNKGDAVASSGRQDAPQILVEKANGASRPIADPGQRSRHVQELIETVDSLPDVNARNLFQECFQSLLALYGDGLQRMLQLTKNAGVDGAKVMDAFVHDKLVRSLLLIHNLHPQDLETRLHGALNKIRPYLQSHGGNVELLDLGNDVARLRLQGTCQTCPSSSVTLELAVRQAIEEACPDLMGFEVEGVTPVGTPTVTRPPGAPHWQIIDGLDSIPAASIRSMILNDEPVVICRLDRSLYAFRNRCALCQAAFDDGTIDNNMLRCPSGHSFDVPRVGISVSDPKIHLDPLPLLESGNTVKIAITH
jgi:Fe-S cluster biogenesis protein NfuA/nitrite reductase/ring-hydroxylating ferredoxin subunit